VARSCRQRRIEKNELRDGARLQGVSIGYGFYVNTCGADLAHFLEKSLKICQICAAGI
jgi:hypothetical protein